jgi:hypothetical protein
MAEVKRFTVEDEKDEYLPALLAEMEKRLITPEDFPGFDRATGEAEALEWSEQRLLILKSLELAAKKPAGSRERMLLEEQAHRLAIPCGCPRQFSGGYRQVPGLRLWLRLMDKRHPVPEKKP